MRKCILFFITFIPILFIISCQSETEMVDDSSYGYDYFPVEIGKSWLYTSDSIILYSGGTKRDTFRSFIREVLSDTFTDAAGNLTFKLDRYFKRNEADSWTSLNTWTTTINKSVAVRTEENIRQVKLVFPIKKGLRWNGNAFLNEELTVDVGGEPISLYKGWSSRMEEIDLIFDFKGQQIPSILVNLAKDNTILNFRDVTEYYGKGIGLLKREMIVFDSDGSKPNDAWESKAQKGFKHTLTLIEVN